MVWKPPVAVTRPIGEPPAGLRIDREGDTLRLSFRWGSASKMVFPAIIALFLALMLGAFLSEPPTMVATVVGVLLIAGGTPALLLALAAVINRTEIVVTRETIEWRHKPIWWKGAQTIRVSGVLQLYVVSAPGGARWGPVAILRAAMENGERPALTWFLLGEKAGHTAHIEKLIEEHLGIINRPIVCPDCGYDLRATAHRCPECGRLLGGTKRERHRWRKAIAAVVRRRRSGQ